MGDDLGTTPSRWALRSGESEGIAVWCPGWGGPSRRRHLLPVAGPRQGLSPPLQAPARVGGGRGGSVASCRQPACCLLLLTLLNAVHAQIF